MNKAEKTATQSENLFSLYTDVEGALVPIDDVIRILNYAYDNFNLDKPKLNKEEQYDLISDYRSLGSMLLLATNTLEKVVEDFQKLAPQHEVNDL